MFPDIENNTIPEFTLLVSQQVNSCVKKAAQTFGFPINLDSLLPGKMLRTAFANRIIESNTDSSDINRLVSACAATELVHTASLCHDDVIDNGMIRRGIPSLWQTTTPSSAVLIGDILLTESIRLLINSCDTGVVNTFISKVEEVCITEAKHELLWRGKKISKSTCFNIARGKTGALFGFVGYVLGGKDSRLSEALEESGYLLGTAYQLFDDYIDIAGDETTHGKTLSSDMKRGKYTFPRLTDATGVFQKINDICLSAMKCVDEWPHAKKGIEVFLENEMKPLSYKSHLAS